MASPTWRRMKGSWQSFAGSLGVNQAFTWLFRGNVVLTLILVSGLGFIAFVFWSPYFHIQKITPNRNTPYIDIVQVQRALDTVYGKNLVFLEHQDVIDLLQEQFPSFREVTLQEIWPNELEVDIVMAAPAFRIQNEETTRTHVIDAEGIVLPIPPTEDLLEIIVEQHPLYIEPNTKLVSVLNLERIQQSDELLEAVTGMLITRRNFLHKAKEYHITLGSGAVIKLDLQRDTTEAINLLGYNIPQFNLTTDPIEYIDLRIADEIYLKKLY